MVRQYYKANRNLRTHCDKKLFFKDARPNENREQIFLPILSHLPSFTNIIALFFHYQLFMIR